MAELIEITTPYIRLDQLLKLASVVGSGGDAKFLITNGFVMLNNEVMTMRGKKVVPGDVVALSYEDQDFIFEVKSAEA
ncbi:MULTISPECIES: RNA-binding S4 domain-containing protein [unclassified Fusibacter]|uniref:RNA-binding S4 domain-containing protein n=1 Tax=unclassified Fusibacter TaxID=2624464 RepID=UPI0010100A65|nr:MULTISPECIES: RNA-binding S4 domain-containing protein [unclassified Fusibacter]MCK8060845.1 RNA-binding S4 domain-containing protein [Fusibacter sp. A2]NPE23141.1 RNA-binding S4 domain-containing protein [Fusibacter sp. A1]RXV59499.1 RNA-binding S4 domain-containing protein [Fusibacter sp. A1]